MTFRKGTKVILASKARKYPEANGLDLPRGAWGIVRTGLDSANEGDDTIGVEWNNYTGGHDLYGVLESDNRSGWYTERGALGLYVKPAKKGVKK